MLPRGREHMMPACCLPPDGMSSVFCSDSSTIQAVEAIDMYVHPPPAPNPSHHLTGRGVRSHAHYGDFGPNRICESAIPEEYKFSRGVAAMGHRQPVSAGDLRAGGGDVAHAKVRGDQAPP